jgi:hypothetical protein
MVLHDIAADGKVLVDQQTSRGGLIAASADGERDLTWSEGSTLADLSPDGGTALFTEHEANEGPGGGVYLRRTDGAPPVRLGEGSALALSRDGRWVLTVRHTTPISLWLLSTGTGAPRALPIGSLDVIQRARFFPDGGHFVMNASEPGRGARLWLYDLDEPAPRPITSDVTSDVGYSFDAAPNGERIASLDPRMGVLRLFSARGDELGVVPQRFPEHEIAGWTEDSNAVYLYTLSIPVQVTRVDVVSGRATPHMTLPAGPARAGIRSIFALLLSADGRSYVYSDVETLSRLYVVEGLSGRR